ncbi:MAG: G5 domain-containing protein [Anaerolineae bacterium]|nr:G5 domain-containing protein [Anaerolineae bacterium]
MSFNVLKPTLYLIALAGLLVVLVACQPEEPAQVPIVSVIEGGIERTYELPESRTVDEFLNDIGIERGELDRVSPPGYIQLTDNTRITIVRVEERVDCEVENIPYQQQRIPREGLQPDEEFIAQSGKNGSQNVCYRITIEDGNETTRIQAGEPTIIEQPVDEIIVFGSDQDPDPIAINGTLAYINNGNAWAITGNTQAKTQLTASSDLDGIAFSLAANGDYLLFTIKSDDTETTINELWLIETSGSKDPVPLVLTDVLQADWVPGRNNVISYSTAEIAPSAPFWDSLNNLWTAQIDPANGESLNPRQILPESVGGYEGWWGTLFAWSSDGTRLAWSRADSVGMINEDGEEIVLANYPLFRTTSPYSWRTTLSWSWDDSQLVFVEHGPPTGSEPADSSPIYNVAVVATNGDFNATVVESAGIWASPQFSPPVRHDGETFDRGYLAYMRARDPFRTVGGEYDLVVADRDGSNAQVVFPLSTQVGIRAVLSGLTSRNFVWSPDGTMIAVVYLGDIWIIDVESGATYQITFDKQSSYPVWSS